MIQFHSGLFLRRAMILISGGSAYVSIAEQQSSVDLERDNMFKHFHGALMLSAWPLHFAQKWDQSHCSLSLLPLSWLCPRWHTSQGQGDVEVCVTRSLACEPIHNSICPPKSNGWSNLVLSHFWGEMCILGGNLRFGTILKKKQKLLAFIAAVWHDINKIQLGNSCL